MGTTELARRRSLLDIDYATDNTGVLIYWDGIGKTPILEPGQPIEDPRMMIGKVGQQNMLANHLRFKPADHASTQLLDEFGEPIGPEVPPGLSGFLFFSEQASNEGAKDFAAQRLGKHLHTKSRVHITQVGDVNEAGWQVYYAPLLYVKARPVNPLHVIMTPDSFNQRPYLPDARLREREALAKTFVRW